MNNIVAVALAALVALSSPASVYDLKMTLKVPRVYDNYSSTGYRRYQTQSVRGTVTASADGTAVVSLENRTHRVGGVRVSYLCEIPRAEWHLVGSNRTGKFTKSSVMLQMEALPSYVPAYTPTDDETLVLTLAGSGTGKTVRGRVAGTLGCGCSWYGHVSPTRDMFTWNVVDKAAVYGTFVMRLVR